MAITNLLMKINERYPSFTKAEKKVAVVVLENSQVVLYLTITDLAELAGVGDTTVFRFCRSLGLNGYQEFKVSLALSTNPQALINNQVVFDNFQESSIEQRCSEIQKAYIAAISDTVQQVDLSAVQQAVEIMIDAKAIYFFGIGASLVSAMNAVNKFSRIVPHIYLQPDIHTQIMIASIMDKNGVAIIFSNSGTTKDCLEIARLVKKRGGKVIFITKFAQTPAREHLDVLLLSGAVEGPMQGGSIGSRISQLFMVDILYTEFFGILGEKAVEHNKITSASIANQML